MDGQVCDRHSSARAAARVLLPSLNVLYVCQHCANTLRFGEPGEFHISYEVVELSA